jgi:tRNA1Val (adenine37-N6)-methyltransferase
MRLKQPRSGYRFSIDAILLASAVTPRMRERVVDLGTGCGIIAMLLAFRRPDLRVWGVELQAGLAALAAENIRDNGWSERVTILQEDLRVLGPERFGAPVDRVVANPPYRRAKTGRVNPDGQRALARHEIAVTLPELMAAVKRILKTRGRLHLIYTAERTAELLGCMRTHGIEPKRLRPIHSRAGEDAALVLVESVKAGRPGLKLSPPLVVHGADGRYTDEVEAVLNASSIPDDNLLKGYEGSGTQGEPKAGKAGTSCK